MLDICSPPDSGNRDFADTVGLAKSSRWLRNRPHSCPHNVRDHRGDFLGEGWACCQHGGAEANTPAVGVEDSLDLVDWQKAAVHC